MNTPLTRGMAQATALTRSGRLQEATALIQSLLNGAAPTPPPPEGDVIDGDFTRLDGSVQAPPAPKAKAKGSASQARAGLGATVRRIMAGGMPGGLAGSSTAPDLAKGAQLLSLTHSSAQGRRDYRLYVPARRPEGPMPLIVMLHGCTQTPEDFATGTGMNALAEEFGCLVAWPAQPSGANAQKCWNWFRPEDQGRDRGEPALIAGLTRDILRDHPADPARVYVAGLSAGGAAAAIMGASYPDLYAAVGVHSGLPVGGARDVASAFSAMRAGSAGKALGQAVPVIVFHGLADGTVHPSNGSAVVDQTLTRHPGLAPTRCAGVSTGGRAYRQTCHQTPDGRSMVEHWEIEGAGHAWAGGASGGSYTDPSGPDASREMVRFFMQHKRARYS